MERTIQRVQGELADPELATLFENCFPNTLDTTVDYGDVDGRPDTFVITGDIEAMWLRDSTAQVWPYLPLVSEDAELQRLVAGVLNRQTRCILIDPYANAFNKEPGESEWKDDLTDMKPELHERKWEVDSLCNPIRPVGLIVSVFRPSDDATTFPFLVPSNHFAVVSLRQLAEMAEPLGLGADFAGRCRALATEVEAALRTHAIVEHPSVGSVWAYEVDGFGNRHHMDDANVPSLLSLPYLGACAKDDPLYLRTRDFVLSANNPYCVQGRAAAGVGGPHAGMDRVWPLGLIMQALTSTSDEEIAGVLGTLKRTHAGTGFMHESFHKDDPADYTRAWFAWANTLFGELVLTVLTERPQILRERK